MQVQFSTSKKISKQMMEKQVAFKAQLDEILTSPQPDHRRQD
jgi:hypothetical protein